MSYLKSEPLVSVVMPVYNDEDLIRRAVQSVLFQTYANLELIVVNDGSTDKTMEILQNMDDPRIRIVQQTNQGVAIARNHGVGVARGELIAFLDSDDLWFPKKS